MRIWIITAVLLGISAFGNIVAQAKEDVPLKEQNPFDECVAIEKTEQGKLCPDSPSTHVTFTNKCAEAIDAQISLQKSGGGWDSGLEHGLKPGRSASYWTCNSTGRVAKSARKAGDKKSPFAAPQE